MEVVDIQPPSRNDTQSDVITPGDVVNAVNERYYSIMEQLIKMEKTILDMRPKNAETDFSWTLPLNSTVELQEVDAKYGQTDMVSVWHLNYLKYFN